MLSRSVMFSVVLVATAANLSCQETREAGRDGVVDSLTFLVGEPGYLGQAKWSRTEYWNGAEDLPAVYLATLSRTSVREIDSLRLYVRAGRVVDLDSAGMIADMDRTDSAATWRELPATLVHATPKDSVPGEHVIASLAPDSVQAWLSRHDTTSPVMTRLTVEIWRQGHATRLTLRATIPE